MQSFRIVKPISLLIPYVRYYWILRDDSVLPVSERTLPTGCMQMVFHRGKQLLTKERGLQPQAFICGQALQFEDVESTGQIEMIVVVFQPQAAKAFLHIPASHFYQQCVATWEVEDVELTDLTKRIEDTPGEDECISLIEQFLIRRLHLLPEYNLKRIAAALEKINVQPQVNAEQLSRAACLGRKQFNRIFMEHVGATPKNFVRIVRMQRALYTIQQQPGMPFAQLADECGFYDQSHMIKEFKQFSGYTPTEYLSVCAPYSDYFSTVD